MKTKERWSVATTRGLSTQHYFLFFVRQSNGESPLSRCFNCKSNPAAARIKNVGHCAWLPRNHSCKVQNGLCVFNCNPKKRFLCLSEGCHTSRRVLVHLAFQPTLYAPVAPCWMPSLPNLKKNRGQGLYFCTYVSSSLFLKINQPLRFQKFVTSLDITEQRQTTDLCP